MGGGVWSMHFIAMLAVRMRMEVRYDVTLSVISAIFAIIASGFAFHLVAEAKRTILRLSFGGLVMGAGAGAMHYTGMAAMQMAVAIRYDPSIFVASVVVAALLSSVALRALSERLCDTGCRGERRRLKD